MENNSELAKSTDKDILEPDFKIPAEVAAEEAIEEPDLKDKNNEQSWLKKFKDAFKRPRDKKIMAASAAVGFLLAGGLIWYFTLRQKPEPPKPVVVKQEVKKEEPPKPTTEPARLSGVMVPIELNKLPVTGIMIENSPDARPQSGLKDAGVVVEAIAEGGITRFLALFQTEQPDYIGPVRSVRPYYLDFMKPFDGGFAHAGGSGDALGQLRAPDSGFKDMDQFFNPEFYQRVSSRYAPHNLYTSRAKMLELQNRNGWGTSNFTGFPRKTEKPQKPPTHRLIDIVMSGYLYNPHFEYDPNTNAYFRSMAGQPHVDERSGERLAPKVVIAVAMPHSYAGIYSVYQVNGSGKAYIFQDGTMVDGQWEKPNRDSQIKFLDAAGKPVNLNPGQTWITLVSTISDVTASP